MENPTLGCGPLNVRSSEICRLCMKTHEYYQNIFVSNEEFKTSIGKAIEDLLILKVAKNDNLPEMVCCPCVTKLMGFREFKEMCMNSAREFGRLAPVEPITCPVKDEFLPMQLLGEATSEMWKNSLDGEHRGSVAPNDLSRDTYASENQSDTKEVCPRDPLGESDDCGEEDFAVTECSEDAAVCRESKPIHDQGEVKRELELPEVVGNVESHGCENIDEGDSSDTGGPILLSDILAVMGMVYRCNNIGGLTEEPEKQSDKFRADRQGISQNKVLNNPSRDLVGEDNLQLEYSMTNSYVVDCFPEGRVKKQKRNINLCASSKKISQSNDRARTVGNQECKQLCNQAENASYPTYYVCNYCSTRYFEKKSLALHMKTHVDGNKSESVLPKKDFPPRFSQRLLLKCRGNVESVVRETSNISLTHINSRFKNETPTVEEYSGGENIGRELYNSGPLLFTSIESRERAAYMCDTCGITCLKKSDLVKHVHVHTGLNPCRYQQKCVVTHPNFKPLKCDLCGKNFKNTKALKRHSVVHTGVKPFKCNECGKMFAQKGHLKDHSFVHLGVKRFKCDECGMMFTTSSHLKSHSVVHTGLKPFKCDECGKKFTRKSDFKRHLVIHTGVKRFKCNECGKMFAQKSDLNTHSVVHNGVKRFHCDECGKKFTGKGVLNRHLVIHTGVKRFKCKECGKMFTQKRDLNTHSVVHTGVKRFKCNECGKMFSTSSYLNMHSVLHTGVTPFKCNECGKMFAIKSYLKRHLVIHSGVKRFKCNECGRMFTQKSHLKRHSFVHTGVKAIKCNECGKMFAQRCHLKMHSFVHTGVKPFKCNECGKMFTLKIHLNRHLFVHTGVKAFKCNECGKMFPRKSYLKRHLVIHSGVKRFKCNECGKMFTQKSHLNAHSVVHTGVKPKSETSVGRGSLKKAFQCALSRPQWCEANQV